MKIDFKNAFLLSILAHVLICGAVVVIMGLTPRSGSELEAYVDLDYQTFDEPPQPAKEERRVVSSVVPQPVSEPKAVVDSTPQEIQDQKGEVAGTQVEKKENNLGSENKGTVADTPYYKIKPKYPRAALVAGAEGWVLFEIEISEEGEVENIRTVDGAQMDLFQSEARRALAKWKYRPFVDESGKPFRKMHHQVRVDFKLTDVESGGG